MRPEYDTEWSAMKEESLEEGEARRLAEDFGRGLTDRWDEWAFELGLWTTPVVTGRFGFTWRPTARDEGGRQIRVGGNWPLLVAPDTGACRLVKGANEFAALKQHIAGSQHPLGPVPLTSR
ncbi:hypothetical protein [Streptomyces incanus]|uniref:Immunity protein 35 domain-containing protein n=1 Tax=Streptomyces incanus TaxID=887453 RepID=A0ABW0XVA2_9ACTN